LVALVLAAPIAALFAWLLVLSAPDRSEERRIALLAGIGLGVGIVGGLYELITTAFGGGVGKRLLNLAIIRERDGEIPEFGTAFLRVGFTWVLGVIPGVGGLLLLADCAWAITDERKRSWHDRVAGTLVVRVPRLSPAVGHKRTVA
jgi:uncharacterized RDD family membrane protein YckC